MPHCRDYGSHMGAWSVRRTVVLGMTACLLTACGQPAALTAAPVAGVSWTGHGSSITVRVTSCARPSVKATPSGDGWLLAALGHSGNRKHCTASVDVDLKTDNPGALLSDNVSKRQWYVAFHRVPPPSFK
jgi:hypothetical protein